jgi:hypothetical protein
MNRALALFAGAFLCLALLPASALAQQATIAGVAKDTSGAVLPGVTVEISSPALIEKTRSAVTDGSGQFQIIQLVPGTYTVTFTLQGFNTFKRDNVEVSGSGVVTVNADMKVGEIAETITVTGQTSLVDVRSAGVQKVVTKEIVDAVPRAAWASTSPRCSRASSSGAAAAWAWPTPTRWRRRTSAARRRHLHGPVDSRRQAGRAAPDHRRPVGGHHHPLRRVAEQLAQLHRHAGDDGEHLRRRRLDGRRRRADQLRAA